MNPFTQAMWSFIFGAVGTAIGAQLAVQKYLDQRRRESAQRRYLDECLDLLGEQVPTQAMRELDNTQVMREAIAHLRAGGGPQMLEVFSRKMTPIGPGLGRATVRVAEIVGDGLLFKAALSSAAVFDRGRIAALGFFEAASVLAAQSDGRAREQFAAEWDERIIKHREHLFATIHALPLAIGQVAQALAVALYAEADFDLGEIRRSLAPTLRDTEPALRQMLISHGLGVLIETPDDRTTGNG